MKEKKGRYHHTLTGVLIGLDNSGKTALVQRWQEKGFSKQYMSTTGADYHFKTYSIEENQLKIQLFALGGKKWNDLETGFYPNKDFYMVAFNLNDPDSFQHAKGKIEILLHYPDAPIILVGTKSDLEKKIEQTEINELVEQYSLDYFETSAQNNSGVNKVFEKVKDLGIKKFELKQGQIEENVENLIEIEAGDKNDEQEEAVAKLKKLCKNYCAHLKKRTSGALFNPIDGKLSIVKKLKGTLTMDGKAQLKLQSFAIKLQEYEDKTQNKNELSKHEDNGLKQFFAAAGRILATVLTVGLALLIPGINKLGSPRFFKSHGEIFTEEAEKILQKSKIN